MSILGTSKEKKRVWFSAIYDSYVIPNLYSEGPEKETPWDMKTFHDDSKNSSKRLKPILKATESKTQTPLETRVKISSIPSKETEKMVHKEKTKRAEMSFIDQTLFARLKVPQILRFFFESSSEDYSVDQWYHQFQTSHNESHSETKNLLETPQPEKPKYSKFSLLNIQQMIWNLYHGILRERNRLGIKHPQSPFLHQLVYPLHKPWDSVTYLLAQNEYILFRTHPVSIQIMSYYVPLLLSDLNRAMASISF